MEKGHHNIDAPALMRRKRKVARQQREKTPEPTSKSGAGRKVSDEESSSTAEQQGVQTIRMQIRPPGSMSAHKSKILSRRDKTFAGAAVRSSSAPREREAGPIEPSNGLDPGEVMHLLRTARRSLSSPRHKEESSESGKSSPPHHITSQSPHTKIQRPVGPHQGASDDDRLTRLERNLQRFEQERRKFEIERLLFEREKRELHRMRYKQLEREDRKRLVESYRKVYGNMTLPSDSDERSRLSESFREARFPSPVKRKVPRSPDYESSTVSSTGDSSDDAFQGDLEDEELIANSVPPIPPERKSRSLSRHSSSISPRRRIVQRTNDSSISQESQESVIETKNITNTEKSPLESPSTVFPEKEEKIEQRKNFFVKLFSFFSKNKPPIKKEREILLPKDTEIKKDTIYPEKLLSVSFVRLAWKESREEWLKIKADYPQEVIKIRALWRKCLAHLIILALFCGFGGLIFRFIEGSWENMYKCEIRKVKRDFIDQLWLTSHNLREDDWKSSARNKLRQFEEGLQTAFEAGLTSYSGMKAWSFVNSVLFCLTVVTTIGYGHIAPKTTLGRGITIIYAIIGIPMFLILLADFGKLFTRMMKFVWAYVRRLYYTGTCRKVRKQQQVRDVMKGMYTVYDYAIRRPSTFIRDMDPEEAREHSNQDDPSNQTETPQSVNLPPQSNTEPPTPYPETFEVDDEFNLPISVATTILLIYIFTGALVYVMWEDWTYFESFYFVFISMSTIGFGDFVPDHPIFMMCSIIYLVFGLALTSMFINVVQIKLSDSFKQASAKIGATIGLTGEGESHQDPGSINQTPSSEIPAPKLQNIPEGIENEIQQRNHLNERNNNTNTSIPINSHPPSNENSSIPPPILPRKPVDGESKPTKEEKKNKRRFF